MFEWDTPNHQVKCWPQMFEEVINDDKPFEYRKNDRNYQKGQTIVLMEYVPSMPHPNGETIPRYTGRSAFVLITGLWTSNDIPGLPEDYVIMAIEVMGIDLDDDEENA